MPPMSHGREADTIERAPAVGIGDTAPGYGVADGPAGRASPAALGRIWTRTPP